MAFLSVANSTISMRELWQQHCEPEQHCDEGRMMMAGLWNHCIKLAVAFSVALVATAAIAAPSKAQIESQYRKWIDHDLWPEAKAAGVSRAVFDQAFAG